MKPSLQHKSAHVYSYELLGVQIRQNIREMVFVFCCLVSLGMQLCIITREMYFSYCKLFQSTMYHKRLRMTVFLFGNSQTYF